MMASRLSFLPVFFLALAAAGCASGPPAPISSAKHLRITYYDFRTGQNSVIGDREDPEFKNLYSKPTKKANVKVTDAEHLKSVVAELADAGYFDHSGTLGSP